MMSNKLVVCTHNITAITQFYKKAKINFQTPLSLSLTLSTYHLRVS